MRIGLVAAAAFCAALYSAAPAGAQTTVQQPLPMPVVLQVPTTFTAAAAGGPRLASGALANDPHLVAHGEFFVPGGTSRSALLDATTRARYQQAMLLNAQRGAGRRLAFKKAKY